MLAHAVDYESDGPVDYACWRMLWITHAGACCGLRMLAHAVDYASQCSLWISQPFGLGRIYPLRCGLEG